MNQIEQIWDKRNFKSFDFDNLKLFQNIAKGSDSDIVVVRGYVVDNMEQSGGVLPETAVWDFMKKLLNKPAEYEARIEGTPKHFAGVVFEELDRDAHVIDEFAIPVSWPFYESIDPADGKPVAWSFFAVGPEEFELTQNRIVNPVYWIDYLKLEKMPISSMCRAVNRKRAEWGYKKPIWVVLDQKYGLRTQTIGEEQTNWHNELQKYDSGVNYVLSQSKHGSIEVGEGIVKEYLKPKYHHLKDANIPTLQIFKRCDDSMDSFNPITHMFSYAKDEDNPSKRTEEYKDFVDTLRYCLERYPRFIDREKPRERPKPKKYFRR